MQSNPLVTIITPVYNGAEYLDDLICSVRDQGYPNIEHIVIDDGSTDDGATVGILKKYSHLRWWSCTNKGQYATMNEGLQAAQGEIVCFICADDLMIPGAIAKAMNVFVSDPDVDIVYGSVLFIDKDSKPYPLLYRRASLWTYPYFSNISHSSLYVKRSTLLSRDLQFRMDLKYVADYDWIIRLIKERLNFVFINEPLSKVRKHEKQNTARYHAAMMAEQKRVRLEHKVNRFAIMFFAGVDAVWNAASVLVALFKTGPRGLVLTIRRWYFKYLRH
jgi:glycosyltransferase involved in cell wall biosynthesis